MSMRRRSATIAVLFLAAVLLCLTVLRASRPRTLARLEGRPLTPPVGERGRIAWLEGSAGKARLVMLRDTHRSVALERASLSGLAVAGDTAYVSASEGDGEKLLRLNLNTGKVETVARLTGRVDQIVQGEGWVVWGESRGGDLPGAPFVVAAEALTALRARQEEGGATTTLAVLRGEADELGEVRLLGIAEGRIYWLEHHQGVTRTTLVRRASLPAGNPETVASETGTRSAALGGGLLAWTAPSREAAEPSAFSAVLERPLAGGQARVIGDWVGARAELAVSGKAVYAREQRRLWRLEGELGDQQSIRSAIPGEVICSIVGNNEYAVVRRGSSYEVVTSPLTWGASLRGLLP